MRDYCDINLVLDRSGSMTSIKEDTIGGVNTFIRQQKELPGEAVFSLYQFDNVYETVVENKPIQEVEPLTDKTFVPCGGTALLDAIGLTIDNVGKRLSSMNEEDRPNKVILIVVTDGFENSSTVYRSKKVITDKIRHQEEKYGWEVIYLGADQDAIAEGSSMGVASFKSMSFEKTSGGISLAATNASNYTSNYRSGKASW